MDKYQQLQEIINRIDNIAHDEWAVSSIKPQDIFFLIERAKKAQEMESILYWMVNAGTNVLNDKE